MRKRLLTAGLTCVILIAGCSSNDGGNSSTLSSDDSMYEITEESSNDSTSESDFVSAFETSEYSSDAMSASASDSSTESNNTTKDDSAKNEKKVDLSDFEGENSRFYGGNLEESLSKVLNSSFTLSDDNYDYYIADGAIDIRDSVVRDGFSVFMKQKVDDFSIYGVYVGMTSDEAVKALADRGLVEESDEYSTIYAIDKHDFYITLQTDNGVVSEVSYSKCIPNNG
ncbi:hypothetical protein [Butyrivibrio sp. INlla21]|uniref:hypothetical protein n=1 Tax=Butyrivibrio sp. INlla21 TaxID=1520811 RepID=UPI0008E19E60|nr:hypothetical protein [Butyrivibrio sp. INlla21]SFU47624.1 hypothetical protein SAMN02910342_00618 [Butyrivibrio sp. INlla21]